jgi:hypothetical protein
VKFTQSVSFKIDGYPLCVLRDSLGNYIVYDGEGEKYCFNQSGKELRRENLHALGFSEAFKFDGSVILKSLNGFCYYSNPDISLLPLKSKFIQPHFWNQNIYFVSHGSIYFWKQDLSEPVRVTEIENVEKLWPCGELLLVVTREKWLVLSIDHSVELLTLDALPFKSCTFLPYNNTFHFVLPRGQMALIDLSCRGVEPFVNQASGIKLKILGTTGDDRMAISYSNQLIFLKAESLRIDEYSTITVEDLPTEPKTVLAHSTLSIFLVQEDDHTAAIWLADESRCLWRSSYESSICYLNFREHDFLIGLQNGFFTNISF